MGSAGLVRRMNRDVAVVVDELLCVVVAAWPCNFNRRQLSFRVGAITIDGPLTTSAQSFKSWKTKL
jgi:hypothetical protein